MVDVGRMVENLNVAVVSCDADFKVTYANEKCKQMFKAAGIEDFVGGHLGDCHSPKTMKRLMAPDLTASTTLSASAKT